MAWKKAKANRNTKQRQRFAASWKSDWQSEKINLAALEAIGDHQRANADHGSETPAANGTEEDENA